MISLLRSSTNRAAQLSRHYATSPGFAGIPQLQHASDWTAFAADAVVKCDEVVDRVVTTPPSAATVRLLDDISDTICQVIDAAEFCRNVHSDTIWRSAAERVCIDLGAYVQQLNTHYGIYSALAKALPQQHAQRHGQEQTLSLSSQNQNQNQEQGQVGEFDEETLLVGKMLLRDFERYGVHLSGADRDRMTSLVAHAQTLGMQIVQNMTDPRLCGELILEGPQNRAALKSISSLPLFLKQAFKPLSNGCPSDGTGVWAPAEGGTLQNLMRHAESPELRKAAYMAYNQQPVSSLALIDSLVEVRHETAKLMGYPSYAHYQLDGFSLAHRPEAVTEFLSTLSTSIRPTCDHQIQQLLNLEHSASSTKSSSSKRKDHQGVLEFKEARPEPWEQNRLIGIGRSSLSSHLITLSSYLSVDSVVAGLSEMVKRLMQVELREEGVPPGSIEGWAPGVRKLTAIHKDEGELGVVYLDLHKRPHKFPGAAHFVLRCGREQHPNSNTYQLPVVCLVANLSSASHESLSHSDAETLCHEMGHALNSLLSRTKFQHLSGTRGPLDVVEIPSHVVEQYAWEPSALQLLCTAKGKEIPPPDSLLQAVAAGGREFGALEVQYQIMLSMVDQLLHSENPPTGVQVEKAIAEIVQQHSSFGHAKGTYPHLRFTHLIGYGATYYSYLFAQCISAQVWQSRLGDAPLAESSGAMLRGALLQPGGAKEPVHYVRDLFLDTTDTGGKNGAKNGAEGKKSDVLVSTHGGSYPALDGLLLKLKI